MEDFKKELNVLLTKYPDLPEFTITIRPRLTVEMGNVRPGIVPLNPFYPASSSLSSTNIPPVVFADEQAAMAKVKSLGLTETTL